MALATYSDLVSAVEDWLSQSNNSNFTARVDDFIALCEARIMYGGEAPVVTQPLRVHDMETLSYASTSASVLQLPADWLAARSLYIDSPRVELRYVAPYEVNGMNGSNSTGVPNFYSVQRTNLVLSPTPDSSYTLYLLYYAKIPALTSSNTTNWLLTSHPNIYLYGTLLEGAMWLRDTEAMQQYGASFAEAVNALQGQDEQNVISGSALMIQTDQAMP